MNIVWKSKKEDCPQALKELLEDIQVGASLETEIAIIHPDETNHIQRQRFLIWTQDLSVQDYNQLRGNPAYLGFISPDLNIEDTKETLKNVQVRLMRNMRQAEIFQRLKSQNLKYENARLKLTDQIEKQTKKLKSSQNELEVKVKFLRHALQIVKSFVEVSSVDSFFQNFKETFGDEDIRDVFLFVREGEFYKLVSLAGKSARNFSLQEIRSFDKKTWADVISRPVINFMTYEMDSETKYILGLEFTSSGMDRSHSFYEKLAYLKNIFTMVLDALLDEEEIKKDSILWADSFKSFKEPIFIIDEFYKIVRSNFGSNNNRKPCYQVLFDRDTPCEKCPITSFHKNRSFKSEGTIALNSKYDLNSFSFELSTEIQQRLWVHHYEDKESIEFLKGQFIKSEKFAYLGNLVDTVIHRISNPLSGMKMSTELLMQDPKALAYQEDIEEIYSALKRCFGIIKNLKGFSESKILVEDINLKELVESTLILMKSVTRDIKFKIEIPSELKVRCSLGLTQQVLFNLIHNSCQAMDFKGDIQIFISHLEDFVALDVVDAGEGIASELQEKIFDPFFSTKSEKKGTGIGLFLSKLIMKQAGGDLELLKELNEKSLLKGAHFRMTFPKMK